MNIQEQINQIAREQIDLCHRFGAIYQPLDFGMMLGVADNYISDLLPYNGLRHRPEGGSCGWFLWAGEELREEDDFFRPMHVFHLVEKGAPGLKYLGLPPGWRFLVAGDSEDVWFDAQRLDT